MKKVSYTLFVLLIVLGAYFVIKFLGGHGNGDVAGGNERDTASGDRVSRGNLYERNGEAELLEIKVDGGEHIVRVRRFRKPMSFREVYESLDSLPPMYKVGCHRFMLFSLNGKPTMEELVAVDKNKEAAAERLKAFIEKAYPSGESGYYETMRACAADSRVLGEIYLGDDEALIVIDMKDKRNDLRCRISLALKRTGGKWARSERDVKENNPLAIHLDRKGYPMFDRLPEGE